MFIYPKTFLFTSFNLFFSLLEQLKGDANIMWFGSDVVTSVFDDMGTDDFSQFIASCAYAFPYVSITVTQTFFLFLLAVLILIF